MAFRRRGRARVGRRSFRGRRGAPRRGRSSMRRRVRPLRIGYRA